MADGQPSSETWLPAADAAAQTGVPLRTLHRWSKAKSVRSRTEDGQRVVELGDVERQAAHRSVSPKGPAQAGITPVARPNGTVAGAADGETAARVFKLLDEGVPPVEIVQRESLTPAVVLRLAEEHARLRQLGKPGEPPLPEQVKALKKELAALQDRLEAMTWEIGDQLGDRGAEVFKLRQEVHAEFEAIRAAFQQVGHRLVQAETNIARHSRSIADVWARMPLR